MVSILDSMRWQCLLSFGLRVSETPFDRVIMVLVLIG